LQGIQSTVTAVIYRNDFGFELRIDLPSELIETRLSRVGEGPLILIAGRSLMRCCRSAVFWAWVSATSVFRGAS
jgi:hypothetical protein